MTNLTWKTLIHPGILMITDDFPPGRTERGRSPITTTLIEGEESAVMVDPGMTVAQGEASLEFVRSSGKTLSAIYVTHGHGDHWFAAQQRRRLPRSTGFRHQGSRRHHGGAGGPEDPAEHLHLPIPRGHVR